MVLQMFCFEGNADEEFRVNKMTKFEHSKPPSRLCPRHNVEKRGPVDL